MPDETKGPNPVSPSPGGETPPAAKPVEPAAAQSDTPTIKAEAPVAAKPSEAATVAPASAAKPTEAAAVSGEKPETAVATKPVSPATGEKPAPAAAKPAAPAAAKPAPKPEGPKPEPWNSELTARLRRRYGSGLQEAGTYLGQKYLVVDSAILYEILLLMHADERFDYCVDITAVHYPEREAQFDIVYVLYSFHHNERVRVKTQIKESDSVRTAVEIWPTANWLEREVYDMFGIKFDGHPDLKRILLPEDWKGYPLRKDYPILQQDKEWVQINLGIESGQ